MKNPTESWRKFIIQEGLSDVLWHWTNIHNMADILKDNRFLTSGAFTKPDTEGKLGKGKSYYLSTTRTPSITSYGSFSSRHPSGAIIQLDGRKLGERFKGAPVDYWATDRWGSSKKAAKVKDGKGPGEDDSFEAEDRVMTDKPYIEDADKYITAVHLALPLYQAKTTDRATGVYKIVPEETLRFSDYNYGRRITGMLEEIGIPFYIHVSPQTWKNVGVSKSKTITSWKEFEQTLRESATNVESAPTVSSLTGDDKEEDEYGEEEIRLFTAAAAAILAGEEKMLTDDVVGDRRWVKEHERKRKAKMFFHMLAKAPAAAANEIQNALHNNSSKPKSRDTIESLASLMRSIKQRDLKGFADYLSQVYKSNHPRGETNY